MKGNFFGSGNMMTAKVNQEMIHAVNQYVDILSCAMLSMTFTSSRRSSTQFRRVVNTLRRSLRRCQIVGVVGATVLRFQAVFGTV